MHVQLEPVMLELLFHYARREAEPYTEWGVADDEEFELQGAPRPLTRWGRALERAFHKWLTDETAVEVDPSAGLVCAPSRTTPGKTYWCSGAACECEAFDLGVAFEGRPFPCIHRAGARLVELHVLCLPPGHPLEPQEETNDDNQ